MENHVLFVLKNIRTAKRTGEKRLKQKEMKRRVLAEYIVEQMKLLRVVRISMSSDRFNGKKFTELLEDRDVLETNLIYIDKLMRKTPEFKAYFNRVRKGESEVSIKHYETKEEKKAIKEECFYLAHHILHMQEKE